jgi:hypothetical protein
MLWRIGVPCSVSLRSFSSIDHLSNVTQVKGSTSPSKEGIVLLFFFLLESDLITFEQGQKTNDRIKRDKTTHFRFSLDWTFNMKFQGGAGSILSRNPLLDSSPIGIFDSEVGGDNCHCLLNSNSTKTSLLNKECSARHVTDFYPLGSFLFTFFYGSSNTSSQQAIITECYQLLQSHSKTDENLASPFLLLSLRSSRSTILHPFEVMSIQLLISILFSLVKVRGDLVL